MNSLTIEEILERVSDLPTMPAATLAVMRETDSATASAQSISSHLIKDQALTMRVLRLANSAYYGLSRQIMSSQEAVVILGTRTVRHLCLVASAYPWLTRALPGYELGPEQLFSHALAVAAGSQVIADQTGRVPRDDAFTVGLLHNVGKLVMSVLMENKLPQMSMIAEKAGFTFDEVERKVFGHDHATVGARLAEAWNLPKVLVNAIRYHHCPDASPEPCLLVDAIHVADFLAMSLGYGLGGDGLQYAFNVNSLERLGLSADSMDDLAAKVIETYDRYELMFQNKAIAA